jgi:hypothetical protein
VSARARLLKNENDPFLIADDTGFRSAALSIFRYQYGQNRVYREWVDLLRIDPGQVRETDDIPFLPIQAFRDHPVYCGDPRGAQVVFRSSATTSQVPSGHFVKNVAIYEESFMRGFRAAYGDPRGYCILALLPGYLERSDSSLVYMCNRLIEATGHPQSGFYLDDMLSLVKTIGSLNASGQPALLFGVSYALMDLSDMKVGLGPNFTVMETGGMKGRREELLKRELHAYLKSRFGVETIHSEYGMTELLSQAYSRGDGLFDPPPWMRFSIREVDDDFALKNDGRTGGVNVIDLANIHSCSFIATQDLGRLHGSRLELMGRYDNSDIRGCNLMIQ